MIGFDPYNWYWIVGGDESKLYSSKTGDYVLPTSEDYLAWTSTGGVPTRIASEAELGEVLDPYSLRPENANILDSYKDSQAKRLTVALVAKVAFNHENRLRALEGKNQITPAQFKNALKALM